MILSDRLQSFVKEGKLTDGDVSEIMTSVTEIKTRAVTSTTEAFEESKKDLELKLEESNSKFEAMNNELTPIKRNAKLKKVNSIIESLVDEKQIKDSLTLFGFDVDSEEEFDLESFKTFLEGRPHLKRDLEVNPLVVKDTFVKPVEKKEENIIEMKGTK